MRDIIGTVVWGIIIYGFAAAVGGTNSPPGPDGPNCATRPRGFCCRIFD
jgi:hypothetical protein